MSGRGSTYQKTRGSSEVRLKKEHAQLFEPPACGRTRATSAPRTSTLLRDFDFACAFACCCCCLPLDGPPLRSGGRTPWFLLQWPRHDVKSCHRGSPMDVLLCADRCSQLTRQRWYRVAGGQWLAGEVAQAVSRGGSQVPVYVRRGIVGMRDGASGQTRLRDTAGINLAGRCWCCWYCNAMPVPGSVWCRGRRQDA